MPPHVAMPEQAGEGAFQVAGIHSLQMFAQSPHPMWIYDLETLRILAVNDAAVRHYGYTREASLGMSVTALYVQSPDPAELRPQPGVGPSGQSRYRKQDGSVIRVELIRHTITYEGRRACAMLAHDVTRHVEAESARQESEDRFRAITEAIPLPMAITRLADSRILFANARFRALFGYTQEDVTRKTVMDFVGDEKARLAMREVLMRGDPVERQLQVRRADGVPIWVSVSMRRMVFGRDPSVIGIAFDDTRRRQAEEALKESEDRFRAVNEAIPQPVVVTRISDGRIVHVNDQFVAFAGRPREAILGTPARDYYGSEQDRAALLEGLERDGRVDGMELQARRPDGTTAWLNVSARRLSFDGSPAILASFFDIGERKRTEEALVAAESKFRGLVEQSLVGIYILQDGRYLYANPRMAEIFGYVQREFIGSARLEDLVDPADRARVVESVRRRLEGEEQNPRYTYRARRRDGTPVEVEVHGTQTEFNGRPAVIGTLLDITDRNRAERALHDRLELEGLIANLSTRFITIPPEEIDDGIHQALETLGNLLRVDRGYVFRFSADGAQMDNTHEWCAEGIPSYRQDLQQIPASRFPWILERLSRSEAVHVPRVADLPLEAATERVEFEREGIRSLVLVPVLYRDRLAGFLGLDAVRSEQSWSDDTIALLRIVGQAIVNALERKRADDSLRYRVEFEKIVTTISAQFINLPFAEIDAGIDRALRSVGEFVGVDRSYIFLRRPDDAETVDNTHEWCAEGIPSSKPDLQKVPITRFAWLADRILRGEVVQVPRVSDLPLEARAERERFLPQGMDWGFVLIPMAVGGGILGILGFDLIRRPGRLSDDTVALLGVVGQILINALERKRAEEALRASSRSLEQAHRLLQENQSQLVQSEKMAALGLLAAGVAHEINNPVGFVMSNLGTLGDYVGVFKALLDAYEALVAAVTEEDRAAARDRIETIRRKEDLPYMLRDVDALLRESQDGAHRVKEIIQALRSFARADEGDRVEVNVNEGLEATLKVVWNEIKYKCRIEKRFAPVPTFPGYPGQINQVFLNLLLNAAQAIPEKGTITVETAVDAGQVVVRVTDTGVGISPENLPKLFSPFFTTKPVGKGTGLGLSISYNIVRKHHGTIEVRSEVGRGSTFTVRLPLPEAPHA
jgi:PAS domain S-box-containing protein